MNLLWPMKALTFLSLPPCLKALSEMSFLAALQSSKNILLRKEKICNQNWM